MVASNHPSLKSAHDFLAFVNGSPTRMAFPLIAYAPSFASVLTELAFHAVRSARHQLQNAGFTQIKVLTSWFQVHRVLNRL